MSDRLVEVRLRVAGGQGFQTDMLKAAQATEQVGKAAQVQSSHSTLAARGLEQLKGAAKGALSTFLGFSAAQAGMALAAKGVSMLRTEVLGLDDALTQSTAIMAHVSGPQRNAMEQAARSMAQQWGMSATTIANGFYYLASAGMDTQQSIRALPQVVAFAKAGMFDLETATSLAVDAQTAMGLRSKDADKNLAGLARTTDVLTEAANASNGSVEQFSEALTNKAAAAGKAFGVSLEETTGVLAAFADTGIKGRRAGEGFSILLRELTTNADKLQALGVAVYDVNGNLLPLDQTIAGLEKRLAGLSVEQKVAVISAAGFSDEGRKMVLQLLGSSNAIKRYTEDLKKAGGATQDVAKKQLQSIVSQLALIREKAIELGRKGIDGLAIFVSWLRTTFGPAFHNIAQVAEDVYNAVAPIAAVFAGAAFVAGKAALEGIAFALEGIAGFLHDNERVVQTVATLIMGRLVVALTATAVAGLRAGAAMLWEQVAAVIGTIRTQLGLLIFALQLSEGAAAKTGVILSAIGPTAGLAALGLMVYDMIGAFRDADTASDKFIQNFRRGFDERTGDGLLRGVRKYEQEYDRLYKKYQSGYGNPFARAFKGAAQLTLPGTGDDFMTKLDSMDKLSKEAKRLGDEIRQGLKTSDKSSRTVLDQLIPDREKIMGINATLGTVDTVQTRLFKMLNPKKSDGQITQAITDYETKFQAFQYKLAMSKGIDIFNTDPAKAAAAKKQLDAVTVSTLAGSKALLTEANSFSVLADDTSTAEEKLKAYTDLLDTLVSKTIATQSAGIGFNDALRGLRDSFKDTGTSALTAGEGWGKLGSAAKDAADPFSKMGESIDQNKSKLLDLVSASVSEAKALADQGLGMDAATTKLEARRKQMEDYLTAVGGGSQKARDDANKLLDSLGLSKDNFDKLLAGQDQNKAAQQLDDVNQKLDQAALVRSLNIDTSSVTAAIQQMNALRRAAGLPTVPIPAPAITSHPDQQYGNHLAAGALLQFFADGGKEKHVAQMAPAGSWRVWAEPETGGEAYIPMALAKRARSMALLRQVASEFGYRVEPKANGGIDSGTSSLIIYSVAVRQGVGIGNYGQIGAIANQYAGRASFAQAAQQARLDNPATDAASTARQQQAVQEALRKTAETYWSVRDAAGKSAADQLANSGLVGQAFEDAAQKMIQAAEAQKRAQQAIEDNQAEMGKLSTDRYLAILQGRLKGLQRYSDEWMTIQRQITQVTREREDNMFTLGKISTANYLAMLKERQKGTREYSTEWMQIQQQIEGITKKYTDPIRSSTSIVSSFGNNNGPVSFGMVSGALGQWITTIKEWGKTIGDLSQLGLNRSLLDQIMQQGPGALPLAKALLAEGAKGIAQINGQLGQLDALTTGFGAGAPAMLDPVRGAPAKLNRVEFGNLLVKFDGLPEGTSTAGAERIVTEAMQALALRISKG